MAGHSKWANIKHKKAKEDSARGKAFTKLSKEITICAREGGGDPAGNPRLRTLLEKARLINMPGDNIKRAIQKGTGELPGVHYEKYVYEGYGPGGIAIMVEVLTDNKNKAIAEVRHAFSKNGGKIADSGAINWMFAQKGVIKATGGKLTEDELLENLLDYDIDDISKDDTLFIITCAPHALNEVREAVKKLGFSIEHDELELVAKENLELSDEDGERAMEFLQSVEALEEVQNVYSNLG